MFNQSLSNPMPLHAGLNKQTVEFTFAILRWLNGCKPDDRTLVLRNENSISSDLLNRQLNRIRVSQQSIAISFIRERCPHL